MTVAATVAPTPKKFPVGDTIAGAGQMVPLSNEPNQTVNVSLNVDGKALDLTLLIRYSEIAGYWLMTIEDKRGTILLENLPLVTGNNPAGNLLGQFAYLGIGSAFVVNASSLNQQDYPGMSTLGTDFVLIWGNTPKHSNLASVLAASSKLVSLSEGDAGLGVLISHLQLPIGGAQN
jgi:Domain of unknown function (DUF6983)